MSSDLSAYTVQDMWNCLEDILVSSIDLHAPLTTTPKPTKSKPLMLNPLIKMKLNKRKRLLKYNRDHNSITKCPEIKILNKEIVTHFRGLKSSNVKRAAMGNKGNIWKAVKIAKNLNVDSLPKNLSLGGIPVAENDIANSFAVYFSKKVTTNVKKTKVNPKVYNGKCKILVQD